MERFNNSRINMRWQAKRTHPSHGLLKGAKAFLLHRAPPRGPLCVNPEVSRGEPYRGQVTNTPDLPKRLLRPSAIADATRFAHIPVAVLEIVRKERSGSNQNYMIISSTYLRTSTCLPVRHRVRTRKLRKACKRSTARPHPGGRPQVLCTASLTAPWIRMRLRPLYMFSAAFRA
eukprot:6484941-Amphidinium_carterae.2